MPETKFGKCPWCERHDQVLYFALGAYDGKLWTDWICARCLNAARQLKQEAVSENMHEGMVRRDDWPGAD